MKRLILLFIIALSILSFRTIAQPVIGMTTFYTTTTTALVSNTACIPTKTVTLSGWLFSVSSTSNCGFNWTSTTGGDGRFQYLVGFGTLTQATFGSDDGSPFALKNLTWGVSTSSWTSKPMQFVGYRLGMPVPGATLNATTPAGTGILNTLVVTFTGNPAFFNVDELRLSPITATCNSILFFEDITIGTASLTCTTPTVSSTGSSGVLCNGGSTGSATMSASGGAPFTYTWSPSGGNAPIATGLSAGIYTCAVTNSCGVVSSQTVSITQPSALITSTAVTNVACNGGSNGVASITASGGAGGYSYLWSTGSSLQTITGLLAGVYTATVTDANGCTAIKSAVVTQPSALVTSTAVTNLACNGGSNGVASITASGGAGGYSYLWSTGSSLQTITGLMAGVYTATVTDANGCTKVKSAIVTQPSALVTSTAVTNIACNGGSNGVASITASGGAGGYSYLWSTGSSLQTITGLLAGVYTATVTDANSCVAIKNVVVTQPSAIVSTTAVTNALCNGTNGSATITLTGGVPPYTYTWSSGPTTSVEPTLLAGTYTVRGTDANNCSSATRTVTITQPSAISTATGYTNAFCYGGVGSASVLASGGTSPYTYTWSTATTGSFITGVPPGSYTVKAIDANNCSSSTRTIIISQPAVLTSTLSITNALCFGGNGSCTITSSGGTSAYTYSWSPGGTYSVVSLSAGTYTVRTTDLNSCTTTNTVTITSPPALVTSTAVTNALCSGNGSGTVTVSGGTGAYTYSWSTGATTSVTSLPAGAHTATVTDANGCSVVASLSVSSSPAIITSTANTNVLCNGGNTGSATVTASGGTGALTYSWSTAATTSVVSGLPAGVYTATITDAASCTKVSTITITQPSALVTTTAVTNVLCNGGNGSGTITASGGTGAYTYLWSTSATASVVSGLPAGVYTATVTDANSCASTKSITITQPSALITTTAIANALCNGSNGSGTITATGGTGAYTYSWSAGATTSVTSLPAGVYTATVTDANGCTASKGVTITQPSALITSTAVTNVLCNGGNGSATITASGGTGAYTYLWSTAATGSVVSGLPAGVYTATVTDANNCAGTKSVTIIQPSALATSTAISNVLCKGGNSGSATVTASGGTSGYTYLWSTTATTSMITGQTAGIKTVTVTDANGCTSINTVSITEPALTLTTNTAIANVLCNGGNTGSATITTNGGTPGYTYLWSTSATTSVITGQTAGVKTVTITDANGCTTINAVTINEPALALSTTTAMSSVLCNGGNTGSATITASGGTPGYTYLWSTSATTSVITGETAGVKTVTVTDVNGCTTSNSVTINQPSALSTSTAVTNVLCNGGNGSGTITATGGTAGYTYLWSTSATTSVISAPAGIYTATVTDANGCTSVKTITISQPPALITSTAVTNVSCFGGNTGSATVTASGGTPGYIYLWSTTATTSVITGETAGVKTVTVTDANGCVSINAATITQPATGLTATITTLNVLCNGGNTGSATVTAGGGSGTYTYLWSTTATTSVITGETAGVKTVTVTDINSCTAISSATVTEPMALVTSTTVGNVLCNGGNTGSATVTTTGGTPSYIYLWSTTATASVITGETAGVKTVTVTDANGCTAVNTVNITEPSALATSTTAANVLCNGGNTGSATVTATGGTPGYIYLWSTTATASVITGEIAGVKTVTVTDANGCTAVSTVNITEPSTLATTTVVSNVLCNGGNTGSATVTTTGGTPPYIYLWSTTATASVITGETAGVKTVTVTDANGCTAVNTVNITEPSALATTTVVSNVLCNGGNTGSATVTATGGTPGYIYLWSTSATTSVITGENAGVKTVTVTDANGCTAVNTVNITEPTALATTTVVSNVLCNGGNTGSATVTATGGTPPYIYLWSTTATTSVITGETAGVKTVTVTDANGCITTSSVLITEPASALITSTITANVLCNGGSTGSATVTATGGTPGYIYLWSTSATTSVITSENAGVKTVTVTDANGCTTTTSVTITEPSALATSTTVTNVLCNGGNTGSATVTATGGTPGYIYLWSTSATTSIITGETIGVKTVTITDVNGCTTTTSVTITEPTILATSTTVANVLCNGGNTGSATVTATGGTPGYVYLWSTSATSSVITGEAAGVKTVIITDANGCTATNTVIISEPVSALTTNTSVINALCNGGASGSATVVANGGTTGYTYLWSTSATTSVITGETAGVKTVTVTDANGCTVTNTVTITEPSAIATTTTVSNVLCNGGNTGSATVTATGGTPGYSYLWSTSATTSVITSETAGVKTVTVTDANGCSTTIGITVTEPSALSAIQTQTNVTCVISGMAEVSVTGGTGSYSYSWSPTGGTAAMSSTLTAGNYTCTITDANSCSLTSVFAITANTVSPTVFIGGDIEITIGDSYQFNPVQTGVVSYSWSPGTYLSSTSIVNPSTTPEADITYVLTVTGSNGCMMSDTVMVKALIGELIIANYMSPNGDGANDTWKVNAPRLIKNYSVEIIDSYGKTVFSVPNNYSNEFDGKSGGQDLPDGVYYYFIKDGNKAKYKGSITLTK